MLVIGAILLLTGFLVYASCSIRAGVYVRCLCRNVKAADAVALTFDDGPDPVMTSRVLDTLKRYDAKATFFVIGSKASRHPEIIARIVAEGHSLGNHSHSHRWYFPLKSTRAICGEITECRRVLEGSAGIPVRFFRPPFGVTNPMVAGAVRKTGSTAVGWSVRSFDTLGRETERVKNRVMRLTEAGGVILLHDNRPRADALLEAILSELRERGLRPVTIDELFNI